MLRAQDVLIVITGSETNGGPQDIFGLNAESIRYTKASGFDEVTGVIARLDVKWTNGTNTTFYNVAEMKE